MWFSDVAVAPSRRDIGEAQRAGARAHHPRSGRDDARDQPDKLVGAVAHVPADLDGRGSQVRRLGRAHCDRVQGRAGAAPRGEQLVHHRIVDHADLDLAADDGGDRDAEVRRAAREIRGAVDRIDDPDRRALGAGASLALLADEPVLGEQPVQPRRDQPLDLAVDFGQVVLRPLEADREGVAVEKAALGDRARLARDGAGDEKASFESAELRSSTGRSSQKWLNEPCSKDERRAVRPEELRRRGPSTAIADARDRDARRGGRRLESAARFPAATAARIS